MAIVGKKADRRSYSSAERTRMDSASTGSRIRRLLFPGDRMGQAPQSRRIRAALCRLGHPMAAFQRSLIRIYRVYWGSAYDLRNRHATGVDTDDNQHAGGDSQS